ncbi:MAG: hypothetical protein FWG16_02530 [Micrococcales bacterium]|nr:hypothetical protein [Micrococcales bacterium]
MPTSLRRYQLSEGPELQAALAVARAAWPEESSTSKLITQLAAVGADHLSADPAIAQAARRAQISDLAGRYPSRLGPNYLDDLRQEWNR